MAFMQMVPLGSYHRHNLTPTNKQKTKRDELQRNAWVTFLMLAEEQATAYSGETQTRLACSILVYFEVYDFHQVVCANAGGLNREG